MSPLPRVLLRCTPGRLALSVVMAVAGAIVSLEHLIWGHSRLWAALGIARRTPQFFDAHNLLAAFDCARTGLDPLFYNPCDAAERVLNYPRIWLIFTPFGLGRGDELLWGSLTALCLAAAIIKLAKPRNAMQVGIWTLATLSPAVQFGVERGNTDLLIFAVVVLALELDPHRKGHGLLALAAAACLKLFPVAAALAWWPSLTTRQRWALGCFTGGFLLLLLATRSDITQIWSALPRRGAHTYGGEVLGYLIANALIVSGHGCGTEDAWRLAGQLGSLLLCCTVTGLSSNTMPRVKQILSFNSASCALYRAGAGIYLLSYFSTANWNYRLVFLLLLLPALLNESQLGLNPKFPKVACKNRAARAVLTLVLAVLWSSGYPRYFLLYIDEWLALLLAVVLCVQLRWLLFPDRNPSKAGSRPSPPKPPTAHATGPRRNANP